MADAEFKFLIVFISFKISHFADLFASCSASFYTRITFSIKNTSIYRGFNLTPSWLHNAEHICGIQVSLKVGIKPKILK